MILRTAGASELTTATLYALLRLRTEVFVVEQQAIYSDLDGHDLAPGTRHCWIEDNRALVSYLRMLTAQDGTTQIGRVVTAAPARGQGLGQRLMHHAIGLSRRPVALNSQVHLADWYARFGFEVSGPEFTFDDELDRIVHVPMSLR